MPTVTVGRENSAGIDPDGVPQSLFDGFAQAAQADTPAWMKGFLDTFNNIGTLRGTPVSDQAWQASWNLAVTASAAAAVACMLRRWAGRVRRPGDRGRRLRRRARPGRACSSRRR